MSKRYLFICPHCDYYRKEYETFDEIPIELQCEFCGTVISWEEIASNTYVNLTEEEKLSLKTKIELKKGKRNGIL